jgi:hypothetical protein
VSCIGATIRNDSGPALHAEGLHVEDLHLSAGFDAVGAGEDGAVRLLCACIGGQMSFVGGTIRNESGPALYADMVQVGWQVLLGEGFTATGTGDDGAVRLPAAKMGQLACLGATIRNESGPALNGHSMQIDYGLLLRRLDVVGAAHSVTT